MGCVGVAVGALCYEDTFGLVRHRSTLKKRFARFWQNTPRVSKGMNEGESKGRGDRNRRSS
jgi:hypothetical protein